jgi:hypothetical protein
MVDLALRQNRGPVTLAAISERQHISLSYLEQLFGKLRRAALAATTLRNPRLPSRSPTSSARSTSRSMQRSAAARRTATTTSAA